jgi:hypothetical protein
MNTPDGTTDIDPWLCAEDQATLAAIRISNARDELAALPPLDRQDYYDRLDGHVCPDNCGICGGEGCLNCLNCGCSRPKCRQKRGRG